MRKRAFGGDADTWMNMQTAYDPWSREQALAAELESVEKIEFAA